MRGSTRLTIPRIASKSNQRNRREPSSAAESSHGWCCMIRTHERREKNKIAIYLPRHSFGTKRERERETDRQRDSNGMENKRREEKEGCRSGIKYRLGRNRERESARENYALCTENKEDIASAIVE